METFWPCKTFPRRNRFHVKTFPRRHDRGHYRRQACASVDVETFLTWKRFPRPKHFHVGRMCPCSKICRRGNVLTWKRLRKVLTGKRFDTRSNVPTSGYENTLERFHVSNVSTSATKPTWKRFDVESFPTRLTCKRCDVETSAKGADVETF